MSGPCCSVRPTRSRRGRYGQADAPHRVDQRQRGNARPCDRPAGREPLDGLGLIGGETTGRCLERKAPGVIFRQPVNQPLQTGLKAVDAMIPIGRGARADYRRPSDRQDGHCDRYDTQSAQQLRGRRSDLLHLRGDRAERFDGGDDRQHAERGGAMDYTVVVAATASDPAAMQYFAPFAGAAIGEYFRDTGRHALVVSTTCRNRRSPIVGGIADSASSVGTRGLSGRYLLPALPSVGARGQDYRPAGKWPRR